MHGLGEGFGETVGQGLHQDGGIIVIGAGETLGDRLLLEAGGDHEGADVIPLAALDRRHEIRQRHPRPPVALGELLAQGEEGRDLFLPRVVGEEADVVLHRPGRPEADHRLRPEPALAQDLGQHRLGIPEEGARGRALLGIVEDGGIAALQLPGLEEGRPIDIARQSGEVVILEHFRAEEGRLRRIIGRPVRLEGAGAGIGQRQAQLLRLRLRMALGDLPVFRADLLDVGVLASPARAAWRRRPPRGWRR